MPTSALIGTRLRERRLAAGLRQADVAATAGISASYLNLIEHNRRRVGAEVLQRLAGALAIDAQGLEAGTGADLVDDLRAAAAGLPGAAAEIDRLEEFVGRFPGWAGLTAALSARAGSLERAVEALNDRMTHDPHLSAALHELLSALTSVRATAEILAETGDLDPGMADRFHRNLHKDSERLAGGAEALVAYLDNTEASRERGLASPQEEVEDWLRGQGWHLAALEAGEAGRAQVLAQVAGLASSAARALAEAHVARAAEDATALPLAGFRAAQERIGPDPGRLAAEFGAGVLAAMRRMALMPGAEAGLVLCDASGTLTFRKPAPGFSLPRFGAACPLWPLYAALARPGAAVRTMVETAGPTGRRFLALAYCEVRLPAGFAGPDLREAAMLILPDAGPRPAEVLGIGSTCRICPRQACAARREPAITREGQ